MPSALRNAKIPNIKYEPPNPQIPHLNKRIHIPERTYPLLTDTLTLVIKDVLNAFRYFPQGLLIGLLVAIFLLLFNIRRKKAQKNRIPIIKSILYTIYIIVVLYLTLFSREAGSRDTVNLTVFGTISATPRAYSYVIENILLFVPWGILLPLLFQRCRHPILCTMTGLAASLFIEITQLLTHRGFFQLDDLIMNTLGTFTGWFLYFVISAVFRYMRPTSKKKNKRSKRI